MSKRILAEVFGVHVPKPREEMLTLRVNAEQKRKLEAMAGKTKTTPSVLVRLLISFFFGEMKKGQNGKNA